MLKKLLITTAVSGLMLSAAVAQSTYQSPGASPSGSSASDATKPGASGAASSSSSMSSSGAASTAAITKQSPNQWLASSFEGTDVLGTDNQKIGDVSDILFTKDGKVEAYIVSVGGFLGVGAKDIALAPSAFQVVQEGENRDSPKLKVNMNKDQLAQAPSFEEYKPQRTTTGSGPAGSTSTAPRANAPASGTGGMMGGSGSQGGASGTGAGGASGTR